MKVQVLLSSLWERIEIIFILNSIASHAQPYTHRHVVKYFLTASSKEGKIKLN